MNPVYLYLHLFTLSFPLVRSFEPRVAYAKKWKALFPAIGLVAAFFIIWDVQFTEMGVWGFNENYLLGINLLQLPVEEWLFFMTVPFASVFIYECVKVFLPDLQTSKLIRNISKSLGICLIAIAIVNNSRLYTFWNLLFTGIMLLFISYKNPRWLGQFWLAYALHLIPFFLVNGILTGSWLESPIVWYNNEHNLSIRLFTIPIEDTVYSLLLLLMNVTLFEHFRNRMLRTKDNPAQF